MNIFFLSLVFIFFIVVLFIFSSDFFFNFFFDKVLSYKIEFLHISEFVKFFFSQICLTCLSILQAVLFFRRLGSKFIPRIFKVYLYAENRVWLV